MGCIVGINKIYPFRYPCQKPITSPTQLLQRPLRPTSFKEASTEIHRPLLYDHTDFRHCDLPPPLRPRVCARHTIMQGAMHKDEVGDGKSRPECRNSVNPYHECVEFCFAWIAEERKRIQTELEERGDDGKIPDERTVHPDCVNASNPYHECGEFCFRIIANAKDRSQRTESPEMQHSDKSALPSDLSANVEQTDDGATAGKSVEKDENEGYPQPTGRQKKLFELQLKMNEARKANQMAMVAEKNKQEAPSESRGVSKIKWLESRKKKIGKLLESNGLDMSKAYMLDKQEVAEEKYKKWEKEPAPSGWDVFNQKALYTAYKKRTKNIECDMDAYNKAKAEDPEFFRSSSSLQYGKAPKIPEQNVDRMVKELHDREAKRATFSRRRKFRDEKDIDSINDRNEHFNKKIERAFGKYTLEIKNNLERGTALPD